MTDPIRVLVVDDSPFICRLITSYLQSAPDLEVVGTALNGARAVELVKHLAPDVITLDLEMPGMRGLDVLRCVMRETPTPVIIISGVSREAAATTLQALGLGAVDFVLKYTPGANTDPATLRHEIIATVRAASRIKVIRSLGHAASSPDPAEPPNEAAAPILPHVLPGGVIVIGASTGGPAALRELLGGLPPDFPAAVVIVQHLPASFTGVLAAQLNRQAPLAVKEAVDGDQLRPGQVLIAPGDYHLLVHAQGEVILNRGPEIRGHRPSIDVTMQSVARAYGAQAQGILLTGMGDDGVQGLVAIRAKGGRTCVQDAASCVVSGMPDRAIEQNVVNHVAPPARIAQILQTAYRPNAHLSNP
jgi:two-component system chemotaxis response regulator CheB